MGLKASFFAWEHKRQSWERWFEERFDLLITKDKRCDFGISLVARYAARECDKEDAG